jgi:tetratricopeptide (TPR) repeat protein
MINTNVGRQLYFARQYASAIEQLQKTLQMDQNFVPAQHAIEAAYAQNGMYKDAVAERQKVLTLSGNPDLAAAIGADYTQSGYPGVLQSWLEGLQEVSKRGYVSAYNIAQIYAQLGEGRQAQAWLEQAFNQRDSKLTYIRVEPAFDQLRTDPQFQLLVQRLGMPQLP